MKPAIPKKIFVRISVIDVAGYEVDVFVYGYCNQAFIKLVRMLLIKEKNT